MHKVRLVSKGTRTHIYLDDKEVECCVSADFEYRVDCVPVVKLAICVTEASIEMDHGDVEVSKTYRKEVLDVAIEKLGLSSRAYNALKWGCVKGETKDLRDRNKTVGDILKVLLNGRLRKYQNLGKKSYQEIQDKLVDLGLISVKVIQREDEETNDGAGVQRGGGNPEERPVADE